MPNYIFISELQTISHFRFALRMGLDYTHPYDALIMAFVEHLAATQRTVASVLSTVSMLKAALLCHEIMVGKFAVPSVATLLRSVKINKRTPAIQSPPVSISDLRLIVIQLYRVDFSHQL